MERAAKAGSARAQYLFGLILPDLDTMSPLDEPSIGKVFQVQNSVLERQGGGKRKLDEKNAGVWAGKRQADGIGKALSEGGQADFGSPRLLAMG